MANEYQTVSWLKGDTATEAKMQQMVANDDFLYAERIDGFFKGVGPTRSTGLKICGGVLRPSVSNGAALERQILFPEGFFSTGSHPVVTVSVSTIHRSKIWVTIRSFDGQSQEIDHVGLRVKMVNDGSDIWSPGTEPLVNYIAFGY